MAKSDTMEVDCGTWYSEGLVERLDRCRRMLFAQGVLTEDQNDKVFDRLSDMKDRLEAAEESVLFPPEPEPEKPELEVAP